jgi:hypothetical protein
MTDIDRTLNFWRNKNCFITGATGFVGKALVEKLLRELGDDCGTIYILIRPKIVRSRKAGIAVSYLIVGGVIASTRLENECSLVAVRGRRHQVSVGGELTRWLLVG